MPPVFKSEEFRFPIGETVPEHFEPSEWLTPHFNTRDLGKFAILEESAAHPFYPGLGMPARYVAFDVDDRTTVERLADARRRHIAEEGVEGTDTPLKLVHVIEPPELTQHQSELLAERQAENPRKFTVEGSLKHDREIEERLAEQLQETS